MKAIIPLISAALSQSTSWNDQFICDYKSKIVSEKYDDGRPLSKDECQEFCVQADSQSYKATKQLQCCEYSLWGDSGFYQCVLYDTDGI